MKAAWLWAVNDVRRRSLSLLALAMFVALASGATIALVAGARRAESASARFATASRLSDLMVFVGADPTAQSPGADLERRIEAVVGALRADTRVSGFERNDTAVIAPDPVQPGTYGYTVISQPGAVPGGFGTPLLLEGRYATGADEIVVNERIAKQFDVHVGDHRNLFGLACFECKPASLGREATVTGIVRLTDDLAATPSTQGLFIVAPGFIDGRWKEWATPGSILWVTIADGADPAAVSQDLSKLVHGGEVATNLSTLDVVRHAGQLQRNALLIAALTVGLIGLLVLVQATNRHLSVRRQEEAVLAALGLDRNERMVAAFLSIAPALLAGAGLSVALSTALSPVMPFGLARRADPDPGFHLDAPVVFGGAGINVLVLLVLGAFVSHRWLGRPTREGTTRPSAVIGWCAARGMRPVPLTGARFALEGGGGTNRLPARSTLFVTAMAVGVICAALIVGSSVNGLLVHPNRYGQDWALRVGTNDDLGALGDQLVKDNAVAAVDLVAQGAVNVRTAGGTSTQINTVGVRGVRRSTAVGVLDGRRPSRSDEIGLGSDTLRTLGLRVGDDVSVSGPCGSRSMSVVGRIIVPLIGGDNPDEGAVMDLGTADALCAGQLVGQIDQNRGALVRLARGADLAQFEARLDEQKFYYEPTSRPGSVSSLLDIRTVPVVVAVVVGLLGGAAIAYALAMSVRRRRHDLAVLRALGLRPSQAGRVITAQAVLIIAVALAVGVPIGLVGGRLLWSSIAGPINLVVHPDVPVRSFTVVAAIGLGATLIVSAWPRRRASRLDPARVLRGE